MIINIKRRLTRLIARFGLSERSKKFAIRNLSPLYSQPSNCRSVVEIDSYPDRQDLSLDLVRLAGKGGCRISIGPDAHSASQLRFIEFGLASALKAKIDHGRILNFMSAFSTGLLGEETKAFWISAAVAVC